MAEDEKAESVQSVAEGTVAQTRKLEPGIEAAPPRPKQTETRVLEPEPDILDQQPTPPAHLGLTRAEMNWAAVAHASILVTVLLGLGTGGLGVILGVAIPAVIWAVYRQKSAYVVEQARQATLFQIIGIVGLAVWTIGGALLLALGWAISAVLVVVLIGVILMLFALILTLLYGVGIVALPIAQMVYGCYAAVEAYHGRAFRYRWISDLIDRVQAQS